MSNPKESLVKNNMDTITLTGTEKRSTGKAWLVDTAEHGEVWLPKSKTERDGDKWTIPLWLAEKKGLAKGQPKTTTTPKAEVTTQSSGNCTLIPADPDDPNYIWEKEHVKCHNCGQVCPTTSVDSCPDCGTVFEWPDDEEDEDGPALTREQEAEMERQVEDRLEQQAIINGELGVESHALDRGSSSLKTGLRVEHTLWYGSSRITNDRTKEVPIEVVEAVRTIAKWSSGLTGGHHAQVEHAYIRGNGWEVTFDEDPTFLSIDEERKAKKAKAEAEANAN